MLGVMKALIEVMHTTSKRFFLKRLIVNVLANFMFGKKNFLERARFGAPVQSVRPTIISPTRSAFAELAVEVSLSNVKTVMKNSRKRANNQQSRSLK